jgi:phage terminase small subunit
MTPRREQFVVEFMVDFNAAAAARRAGFSAQSAPRYAKYLLRQREVADAIAARVAAAEGTIRVTADRVLSELALIAFADIRRYVRIVDGKLALVPSAELEPGAAGAIAVVAPAGPRAGARIRLHGKIRALRALVKHLGLEERRAFVDPKEQNRKAMAVFARLVRESGIEPPPGFLLPPPDKLQ